MTNAGMVGFIYYWCSVLDERNLIRMFLVSGLRQITYESCYLYRMVSEFLLEVLEILNCHACIAMLSLLNVASIIDQEALTVEQRHDLSTIL